MTRVAGKDVKQERASSVADIEVQLSPDLTDDESWRLAWRSQTGDMHSFARLYSAYYQDVYCFVRGRVASTVHAEDITGETFLRALRAIGSLRRDHGTVRGWLFTIARNLMVDRARSKHSRTTLLGGTTIADLQVAADDPEGAVVAESVVAEVRRGMEALTADQRLCLFLRFEREMSVPETAAEMNRVPNAVRQLQHRAVSRLGQQMTGLLERDQG